MSDLRRELELLADELTYPPTPDLAAAVATGIAAAPRRAIRRRHQRRLRLVIVTALLVLLLAATALAASRAVREFFGLQGATVERTDRDLSAVPPGGPADLGERVSIDEAERGASYDVLVPARAGAPDDVRLRGETTGGEVSLVYRPGPGLPRSEPTGLGLLVTEFRGDIHPDYMRKVVPQTTRVERMQVNGERAIWIEGAPHLFFYRPPGADFAERPLRLAANVLLIERGPVLVRLEGSFGRDEAVALARSLR